MPPSRGGSGHEQLVPAGASCPWPMTPRPGGVDLELAPRGAARRCAAMCVDARRRAAMAHAATPRRRRPSADQAIVPDHGHGAKADREHPLKIRTDDATPRRRRPFVRVGCESPSGTRSSAATLVAACWRALDRVPRAAPSVLDECSSRRTSVGVGVRCRHPMVSSPLTRVQSSGRCHQGLVAMTTPTSNPGPIWMRQGTTARPPRRGSVCGMLAGAGRGLAPAPPRPRRGSFAACWRGTDEAPLGAVSATAR